MGDAIYFNVDDDGRLWHVLSASDVWMYANVSTIRVVARSGKKWFMDPPFQKWLLCCSLWVFQKKSFYNLDKDSVDYQWKNPSVSGNGKHLEFLQYLVKIDRNLLLQSKYKCPAAMKH